MMLKVSKLRKLAFKIINSTTLLLPVWKETLEDLDLAVRLMPRDVRTRWNSTYDVISFALEYRDAITSLTADRTNKLREFELSSEEWDIADELAETLKVSSTRSSSDNIDTLTRSAYCVMVVILRLCQVWTDHEVVKPFAHGRYIFPSLLSTFCSSSACSTTDTRPSASH
jgi:hypothetical protein